MRDINFFSTFAPSKVALVKTPQDAKRLRIALIAILAVVGLHVAAGGYTLYQNMEVRRINQFFELQTTKDTIANINRQQAQIVELGKYKAMCESANKSLVSISVINDKLITQINHVVPLPVQLGTLAATTDKISIKGITPAPIHVAELVNNLNALDFIENAHVSEIKEDEKSNSGSLSFLVECKLSGGIK